MGVDIGTYRCRIGTFRHGTGHDVVILKLCLNYRGGIQMVGAVAFIGMLLLMAGIESNPGPPTKDSEQDTSSRPIDTILKKIGLEQYISVFKDQKITVDIINKLTETDFKDIGVTIVGDRVRIRSACEDYTKEINKKHQPSNTDSTQVDANIDTAQGSDVSLTIYKPEINKEHLLDLSNTDSTQVDANIDIAQSSDASLTIYKPGTASVSKTDEITTQSPKTMKVEDCDEALGQYCKEKEDAIQSETVIKKEDSTPAKLFDSLLQRLNLDKLFPGKITFTDVVMVDDDKPILTSNLPWQMLKAILMSDSGARDITVRQAIPDETDISPLDVLLLLYQCSDAMLKRKLYQALWMSKIAVPFLYINPRTSRYTMPVWPMRSLVIEWGDMQGHKLENYIYDQPTAIVSFARIGRPLFSKSKLLNGILFDSKHNAFYNKDSPFGTNSRYVCNRYVESAWYLPAGNENDLFNDVVTFLNIRGDIFKEINSETTDFLTRITDIFIVCMDIDMLKTSITDFIFSTFKSNKVIVLLTNETRMEDGIAHTLTRKLTNMNVIRTTQNRNEKSASDIQLNVQEKIKKEMQKILLKAMTNSLGCHSQFDIRSDEEHVDCTKGCELAKQMMCELELAKPESKWKELVTPLQFHFSIKLKDLNRQMRRSWDTIEEVTAIEQNILQIKLSQSKRISKSMVTFIKLINANVHHKTISIYFIEWLHLFLERKSRNVLPTIKAKHSRAWEELKKLKNTQAPAHAIKEQAAIVKIAEVEIANASFGLEHLFREIAHVFEALKVVKGKLTGLPKPVIISTVVAKLITYGYSFELLDGDSSYIAIDWLKSILKHIEGYSNAKRVLTVSVLGVQSSGKSTLLNTMFGLQFAVNAGRCTRGVYVQLLPCPKSNKLFDHIMIIDSEGLRAPELRDEHQNHDNELATFVVGLANITLLNIKGENTNEINNILQIVIHAFMRLRLANERLDTGQNCVLVHQNVAPISADKMKYSLQKLVEQLDNMTLEAANSERISGITAFNQVIAFNETEHVFYIPDLWKGDPPMAATNIGYVRSVAKLREQISNFNKNEKTQSFRSLENISHQINDLWKGILSEDFVFSFKNSLEIKASLLMDETYKQIAWKLEKYIRFISQKESEKAFNKCDTEEEVYKRFEELKCKLTDKLEKKYGETSLELSKFFDQNDYTEIIIHWKENRLNRFKELSSELELEITRDIKLLGNKRKCTIKMYLSQKEHDSKLYNASIKLAKELKGREYSKEDITTRFKEIWTPYVEGLKRSEPECLFLREIFIKRLRERVFSSDTHIIRDTISKYEREFSSLKFNKMRGSFGYMTISESDLIVTSSDSHIVQNLKNLFSKSENVMKAVQSSTEVFLKNVDSIIDHNLHEDNELDVYHVHELLYEVEAWMNNLRVENGSATIFPNKLFKAKLCLFISCHGQRVFQRHNVEFRKQNRIDSDKKLETYKKVVKERFRGYLINRAAEMTAAICFKVSIEEFVHITVHSRMSLNVECDLENQLPSSKYSIIIDILSSLVGRGAFQDFIDYIELPHGYMVRYVTEKAYDLLFKDNKYFELAKNEIEKVIADIANGINATRDKIAERDKNEKVTVIDDWVKLLRDNVSNCTIEDEVFKDVKRENVTDFKNFSKILTEQLKDVHQNLIAKFKCMNQDSIKWTGTNPIFKFSKKVWGCEEQCVYCGEPCCKGDKHACDHHSIQHRPVCIRGTKDIFTHEANNKSCNFLVQSCIQHNCQTCQFLCNEAEKVHCKEEWHPYRKYRTILRNWVIEPNSDMGETCKFWMWFIVKYKTELEEHYSYTLDHIPEDWNSITHQDALDSLTGLYTIPSIESTYEML